MSQRDTITGHNSDPDLVYLRDIQIPRLIDERGLGFQMLACVSPPQLESCYSMISWFALSYHNLQAGLSKSFEKFTLVFNYGIP